MLTAEIIRKALEEDLGDGDHTSLACIPRGNFQKAKLLVKEPGVIAGIDVAREVFHQVDPALSMEVFMEDGTVVMPGDIVFLVSGDPVSILSAERLALNLMQRMSGIATKTRYLTELIRHTKARILDTRKTTPLLRLLEKEAVKIGGGMNHRFGLYDMIMIKDNHVDYAGGIAAAIERAVQYIRDKGLSLDIEVETRNFEEIQQVIHTGGIRRIMLDNFKPSDLKMAVTMIDGRFETEASGGITSDNIVEYAETGVDFISVGALTHSVKSLDLSLKAVRQ